jgi:hypothetical protein
MLATDAIAATPVVEVAGTPTAAEARLQRNVKIVVIALAVLIFAGLATVIGRVIYLASASATQPAGLRSALRPEQSLLLPFGAQVRSVSLSGNRLAVHYEAAGTEGIVVLDLQTGEKITSVGVERAAPAN